jgi:hypothetical protein
MRSFDDQVSQQSQGKEQKGDHREKDPRLGKVMQEKYIPDEHPGRENAHHQDDRREKLEGIVIQGNFQKDFKKIQGIPEWTDLGFAFPSEIVDRKIIHFVSATEHAQGDGDGEGETVRIQVKEAQGNIPVKDPQSRIDVRDPGIGYVISQPQYEEFGDSLQGGIGDILSRAAANHHVEFVFQVMLKEIGDPFIRVGAVGIGNADGPVGCMTYAGFQ